MPASTTSMVLPYPIDTDNPNTLAVHTAIQNLATTFDAFFGAWDDAPWTPTISQGATGNIAKTVDVARVRQQGRLREFEMRCTISGTGTASAAVGFSLPYTTRKSGILCVGWGGVFDTSASQEYTRAAILNSGSNTVVAFQSTSGLIGASAFTAALAAGDVIWCIGFFE